MVDQSVQLDLKLQFPLADGRVLVQGPLSFNADGLATSNDSSFLADPRFQSAYEFGLRLHPLELHVEWRAWIAIWAAEQALRAEGDFVECGVYTGIFAGVVAQWTDFARRKDRAFWLVDTFEGLPDEQLSEGERRLGIHNVYAEYKTRDVLAAVQEKFAPFPNVRFVRGKVPDVLPAVSAERIAYLSIDMNMVAPEIAAARHFWARLSPGAVILLDDYNWPLHQHQKTAFDALARELDVPILGLPTGQGLIVKPHR